DKLPEISPIGLTPTGRSFGNFRSALGYSACVLRHPACWTHGQSEHVTKVGLRPAVGWRGRSGFAEAPETEYD
ncbi:MAG: hypothetical protein WCJ09_21360, partial [Planctomycetota bacterium]